MTSISSDSVPPANHSPFRPSFIADFTASSQLEIALSLLIGGQCGGRRQDVPPPDSDPKERSQSFLYITTTYYGVHST